MTRRYLLVASTAASFGYVVGWLAGSNVQRLAEGRRLARPGVAVRPLEPRSPVLGTPRRSDLSAALTEAIPAQRADEPCTERSPGGGLVCCRKGAHASHLFEGSTARDRKADADQEVE